MTILLINDDTADSIAVQKRLPKNLNVSLVSQYQARCLKTYDYDVIALDNDANDLKESKGAETLKNIMKIGTRAKIFFTSFQPAMIPNEVYRTNGVKTLRTDDLLATLKKEFNLRLRKAPREPKTRPKTTLIITYNTVEGYEEGAYNHGKLIILSYNKNAGYEAEEVVKNKLAKIYANFNWRSDRDFIKNIFVYDGINGKEWPTRMAQALGHDIRMKIQLLACSCP